MALQWNQRSGNYEAEYDGHILDVRGDIISETLQAAARERFGVDYADLDAAQTTRVDAEVLAAYGWDDPEYYRELA